jgi:predicted NAD/FAD-binding protein
LLRIRSDFVTDENTANFLAFLRKVGIRTEPTEFSFKVCRAERSHWLWSGNARIRGIHAGATNLLSPRIWRVILDTVRFNQAAIDILLRKDSLGVEETICQFLDREGYSNAFRDDYLLPLVCSLQGLSPVTLALEIPAVSLIRFL